MKCFNRDSKCVHDTYTKEEVNNKTQENITTNGSAVKCGYKVDGKDVYVKRISVTTDVNVKSEAHIVTDIPLNTTIIDDKCYWFQNGKTRDKLPSYVAGSMYLTYYFNSGSNGMRKITIYNNLENQSQNLTGEEFHITVWYINN